MKATLTSQRITCALIRSRIKAVLTAGYSWYDYMRTVALFYSEGVLAAGGTELVNNVGANATITDQLVTNGDMEADFNPFEILTNPPTVNERTTAEKHSGTACRYIELVLPTVQIGFRTKFYTIKKGETVTWSFWVKVVSGATTLKYVVRNAAGTGYAASGNCTVSVGSWVQTTGSYVETTGGDGGYIGIYLSNGGTKLFYVDDISVTTDGAAGKAFILPYNADAPASDPDEILYDSSGYGLTIRRKAYLGMHNERVMNFAQENIIVLKPTSSRYDFCKVMEHVDEGALFYDSLENVVSVKADGTGDYLTIAAAVAGITDANKYNRYRIDLYDDISLTQLAEYTIVYGDYRWHFNLKDHVYLQGAGGGKTITGTIPDDSTDAQSTFYEVCSVNQHAGMKDMTIIMSNGRYAIHIDSSDAAGDKQSFYDCHFQQLGNMGIINYRIANSLPYGGVSVGNTAVGTGLYTGQEMYFKGGSIKGMNPFACHTNANFSKAAKVTLFNVQLISDPLYHPTWNPDSEILAGIIPASLTSNLMNAMNIYKGSANGWIQYTATYWDTVYTDRYILKDWIISTYLCKFTSFNVDGAKLGGSLRITSATADGTVTNIAGTAAAVIMPTPDEEDNHATGRMEVGLWAKNAAVALGARLGNCTVVNKVLTLDVDGTPKTITFNENFTAATIDYILAFINTALAGSATASLYQRAQENQLITLT